jgi:hypothetical protein
MYAFPASVNTGGGVHEMIVVDGGMTGFHPVGFIDLIAEIMKKKSSNP